MKQTIILLLALSAIFSAQGQDSQLTWIHKVTTEIIQLKRQSYLQAKNIDSLKNVLAGPRIVTGWILDHYTLKSQVEKLQDRITMLEAELKGPFTDWYLGSDTGRISSICPTCPIITTLGQVDTLITYIMPDSITYRIPVKKKKK